MLKQSVRCSDTVKQSTSAFEAIPLLNDTLKLVPLPSDAFRKNILVVLGMSVFGSMLWDRLCVALFAPKLLWVGYVDAWNALPPWKVMCYEVSKYVYLAGVLVLYANTSQSLMTLLGGWWLWRKLYGPQPMQPPPGVEGGPAAPELPAAEQQKAQMTQAAGQKAGRKGAKGSI